MMSAAKLWPFLLAVGGSCSLHLLQKTMPAGANAGATLGVAYLVATITCIALFPVFMLSGQSPLDGLKTVPWKAIALGLAIVTCEIGILLTYRAGWPVGTTAVSISAVMTLLLLPIGMLLFGEALTLARAGGLVLTLAGLYLLLR